MRKLNNVVLVSLTAIFCLIFTAISAAQTTLSTTSVNFGNVVVNTTSSPKFVIITNTGAASISISSLSVTAASPYSITPASTCLNPTLAAGKSCTVLLTLSPTTVGAQPAGTLTITTTAPNSPQTVALSGTGVAATALNWSTLNFGNVVVGATSPVLTATLSNNQSSALSITSLVPLGAGFAVDGSTTCGSTLAANSVCKVAVTFAPAALGAVTGSLTINTNAANSPLTIALSGTGVNPTAVFPSSLNLGNVVVGQTSAIKTATLYNYQTTALAITSILAPAPYTISSTTCGSTLGAGASCAISLTLAPTAAGAVAATSLTITSNASNSPLTVPLTGTGVGPVSLGATIFHFSPQVVGTTSAPKALILNNNQASSLTISSVVFGGPLVLDSSAVTTCPTSGGSVSGTLAAGASCVIGVDFKPTAVGAASGAQITVIDSASNSPQIATATGAGLAAVSVTPNTVVFGNVMVSTTSAAKTITVTNNQTANLNFSSISVSAPYAVVSGSTTCVVGTPVTPGSSCVINLTYSPTSAGTALASTLTISDDAPSSPQAVPLYGTGIAPVTLNPAALSFGLVGLNATVVESLTLKNNQSTALTITGLTGFPANYSLNSAQTTCPLTPNTLAAGGSCVIAVSYTPTTTGVQSGTIGINDNASTSPQSFTVIADAIQPVKVSPASLSFTGQFVGSTSAPQTITVTNSQSIPASITAASIIGTNNNDFAISATTCPFSPATLPAGANCQIQVTFTPSGPGARTASLSINDPLIIPLTGLGNAPVTVLPGLLSFSAPVGTTSAYQTVTIKNASTSSVQFNVLQLSGPFVQTSTSCGTLPFTLAGGASCAVTLSFNPTIGGVGDGQLQVYDTAVTSPQVINLTGNGTYPLTLSPTSLSFSGQTVGSASTAKIVVLTNHENKSETFTLTPAGDFTADSNCPGPTRIIAANSTCNIFVAFAPSATGTRTGSVTVTDTAAGGFPLVLPATGSGTATNPAAAIAVISPGAGAAGTTVNVVITGNQWTHFNAGSWIQVLDQNSQTIPADIVATIPNPASTLSNTIHAKFVITGGAGVVYGARYVKVASPLSGGGTEYAALNSAFIITDPGNAHTITTVMPANAIQGQTLNVDLTATGTHFVQGVTYANFGDGVTVNTLAIDPSGLMAHANITISNTTPVGYRTITLVTGGEFATSNSTAFYIGPNSATFTGLTLYDMTASSCTATPVVEPQGWSGEVCLTATGTHFLQNATGVSFTGGILTGNVQVTSTTTAIANVAITAGATIGLQNATVSTGGEIASLTGALTVTGATPYLVSVSPNSAQQGTSPTVVINANSYMNFVSGQVSATFDGNISSPTVNVITPTRVSIPISISNNANVGSITANLIVGPVGSTTLYPFTFTVTPSGAAITSVTPSCVPQGGQLTLNVGAINTNWVQGTTTANFYPVPVPAPSFDEITINSATSAALAVAVPTNTPPGAYGFYMSTGGQVVSASINVCAATPTLTMSPANGLLPSGSAVNSFTVNFTGQFTHFGPTTLPVISGEGITLTGFNVTGTTSATATINIVGVTNGTQTATGPRKVTFTTGGEIVTTYFNVTKTPVGIINISPYQAPQSATATVEIYGLNTHFNPNTTQVLFGPQITVNNASLNVIDATHLTVSVTTSYMDLGTLLPSPYGWQNVYVNSSTGTGYTTASGVPTTTNGAGSGAVISITASNGNLTSCTATTPGSGYIAGDYVYPTQSGATGSSCLVTAVSGSGVLTMTSSVEQVMGGFLVDSPALPSIVSVVPNSAPQGGTLTGVVITGNLTNWDNTTEAILGAGVTVSNLNVTSPTTATADIAVSATAPVGGNSVIMITGAIGQQTVVSGSGFSVTPNAATISIVSPVSCNANAITIADFCGVNNGSGTPYVITQLQTATLNVVGVGTHWLQGETTFSFGTGVVTDALTVTDSTHAQVQITVLSTSPVGFAPLTTTTDGEVVTLQQAIDIEEGFPALLATTPNAGEQANTFDMQVLGRFTNWGPTTVAQFNKDITVNSINVIDNDNMILNVTVSPWAYVDYGTPCGHYLTITTGTVQEIGDQPPSGIPPYYFCVQQGGEEITNVTPLTTIQGSTVPVTITGQFTNFLAGVTQVSFGDSNFAVGQITVNNPTSLTVPVAVSTAATPGFKNVTVTTYGQVASQLYSFTVTPSVATLNEAIPNQAEQGAPIVTSPTCPTLPYCTVRLIGQYSHFSSLSTATFGAGITVDGITYISPTEVDAQINIDPLSYTGGRLVTVTTPGVSCAYQPPVAVTNVTYNGCTPGVPTGTGSEIVSNNVFSIIQGPAIISQVSPNTGNEGQEVVFNITGEATHWSQSFTRFYISGAGYDLTVNSVTINSATSATVDLTISPTANPGPRSIYMVTDGEALADSGAFVVTGGVPVITYVSPNSGLKGTTGLGVDIYGLYTQWTTAATTINFGPGVTVASYQVDNNTHIEAVLNIDPAAQGGYRTVTAVTTGIAGAPNGGVQILTGNFLVTVPAPPPTPYIWYESPSSGLPGQTFTITFLGQYTQWDPNPTLGTQLTGFDNTDPSTGITINTFQVTSPTTALANITIGPNATAFTSDLTLTTNTTIPQEVDHAQFNVVIAQPTLTVIDPGSAMQGTQNLVVNIIGSYTSFDSTTTFNFGPGVTVNGPPTIIGPTIASQSISVAQLATLGGRSVVATTSDIVGLGHVVGGGYFSVTPSLAQIAAVTPNTAAQGATITVDVAGLNTHWDGSTVFQFGSGITVTNKIVNTPTDATVSLYIPPYTTEGPTWASATTLGEVANLNNAFVVQAGTPYLLSSGPGSEPQQGAAVFTILSQATNWLTNTPTVSYGDGVVLTNVNVTSNTSLTVDGYIQPTTPTGYRNLSVSTSTQTLGLNYALYIAPGPAVINNVVASSAGQGATLNVTINGTNTHWQQGVSVLTFPNVVVNGTPTVVSPTQISANITVNDSAPAGEESVTVTTLGEIASGVNVFDIIQTQPELLGVVASSGASAGLHSAVQGWTGTVNLTGAYTHFTNSSVVNFGSGITVNSVSASSATSLQANISISPTIPLGWHTVSVTSLGGSEVVSITNAFQVTVGPAAIVEALNPYNAPQNWSGNVIVVGSQTHWVQGVTTAYFGPYININSVTVTDAQHATVNITVQPSAPLTFYDVSLTTVGEVATGLGAFTVTSGAPSLIAINPPFAHLGDGDAPYYVEITGRYTHFNGSSCSVPNPCSTVSFGAGITVNSIVVNSATDIQANITVSPVGTTGSRTITVTTGTEVASMVGGFTVLPGVPALTTVTPNSGQAGQTVTVTINGQFTNFQQGFTSVTFGGGLPAPSIVTVNSLTQVQATLNIPSNASVGTSDITVTTNGTPLTLSGGFTVTPGTPVITQISPNIGNPGQTALSLNLTGQYTNWTAASTVTIGTVADGITVVGAAGPGQPGPVTYNSPTSVTVTLNIAAGAPVGPAGVTIATGGSTQSVAGGFTVQAAVIPPPSILSISPGMNAGGIPINSNFYVVFSQPMNIATFTNSNITLRLTSNQGQGWITIPIGISGDATGRVLTIMPSTPLAVNSQYYLYLTNGITDSTAAHNSINAYGQYFNTVFTASTVSPTVVAFNPPALSTVGTNVPVELEFSVPMNQGTDTGMTVTGPGGAVAGSFLWNSNPFGSYPAGWGPGTVLYFTPTAPLAASTTYTVAWGAPLADTEGNAVTPGSFTFTTGSGADTTTNNASGDIANGQTNVGTNVAPQMFYQKPISPININTGTLQLYNSDSGKYINGTVTVAPNGMSATFTPAVPLLPNTYYRLYQAGGYYDADGYTPTNTGAYLNGLNTYFTTGNGSDLVAPSVASVSPANNATAAPLNAQVIVKFSTPVDPDAVSNIITVTPSGGSAISGTASLASDLVTLFFVPTGVLAPGTNYTVSVSGYQDVVGNVGTPFSSTFTTAASIAPINVSTGFNASGQLITTNNTADAHWSVYPLSSEPSETTFAPPATGTPQALLTVGTGDAGFYSGWPVNGPKSDWININPNSTTGNTYGLYYTTFNISGSVPNNLCLVGAMGIDDNGLLAINGTAITGNINAIYSMTPLNVAIPAGVLNVGQNTLALGWGSTDNYDEAFRLQGVIETCGASETPATSVNNNTAALVVTSATPSWSAGGVATNSTIQLVFNNSLDPATVNSTTLPVMIGWNSNAEIAGAYTFSTTNVPNDTVTFTPDTPFPISTQIWVGACNGPYDLAGDNAAYSGCYTQITYFTTAATIASGQPTITPFTVAAFTPANGATNVGLRAPVTATFNRSLNFGSVNNNDYALFNGDSQTPWCDGGSYSHSQDGTSISFNCGALPSSATLTAMLGSGLSDWNGDALTPYTSQFTTTYYDWNTHGSLITQRPGNGAGSVDPSLPIVLYFNYPINPSNPNGDIEVAQNNVAVPGTAQVLDGGYTLEFTPSVPWTPGALIQWWTTGNMTDVWYNATFNSYSGYFYVAGSTATLTPSVQVAVPAMYTNPVPLNSIFDLQFNTPLNSATVNSTNVYIFDNSNGNVHIPMTITQPQPNEILMKPTGILPVNHYLYVFIGSGLQSTTSVPATQTQWWEYTGTTSDGTLPVVTSAVPFNGATGVGVNDQPGVVFNKPIDVVSLNSSTFQVTNGGTPLTGSYWFSSSDTRVEFVPNTPLPANTNLVMSLNGVTDQVGNPVTFSSSFTTGATPDVTAPTVVTTSISSSGSVPTNASITIQFSTSMDATTFSTGNSGDIYIYDTLLGTRVPATLSWNSAQTVAYLTPSSYLSAGREYYFYVNTGTDLAGNQVNGIEITFYAQFAGASTAPTVINFNPISGATGLGTNTIIEAQFSAAIDPNFLTGVTLAGGGPVTISTSLSAGNTILQINPQALLQPNTIYTLTIAGVKDPAGNTVATTSSTFTTGASYDITSAVAVNIDPSNYATVGTNVAPKIVFNKPLNPIYVNNSYFQLVLSDTSQWIPLTVTMSPDGKTVTLTPQDVLLPNTEYRYYAGSGLQDEDGNGVNQGWYYFYTGAGAVTSPLTVSSVSPANAATGIPLNAQVIAMLNAPMDPTSWNQNSIVLLSGANPVAGTVNWINAQELTFAPTSALATSTTYTVKISGFKDANGNAVVPSTTTFTTGTLASTGGLSFTGSNIGWGATVTNPSQPIVLTFSQPLDPATVNSNTLLVMDTWNSNRGLPGTYTVGTGVNANQVTFAPTEPYPSGAQITVGECGGPTDILGDVFQNGGCYGQQLVYFYAPTYTAGTVGDPMSLSILSVSPANGATNVGHDQPVSVTFNNPINNNSTGSYNTELFAGQDLQDNGSVTLSADGRTLTFNIGALYNGTTYTIAIPAGGVTDEWGNSLTTSKTFTFTTSVNPATGAGSVQSVNPAWNTSGVPTNNLLTLYMNRPVNASTVSNSSITVTVNGQVYTGTVAVTGGGYEIQYTPNTPFPYGATVQWWFAGNVQDVYGDFFNANSNYFYTVGAPANPATASPTVIAISPRCCGSSGLPTNTNVDIEFSQPIDPTTLTGNVYINSGPATPFTLSQPSPNVVRITPTTPWNASNVFYGFCTNANVKGTNGVAATSDCWATYFYTGTTTDTTPGTIKIGPPNSVSNVGTNAYIRLQFSKPVDITTINTTNIAITTSGNPIPGSFSYNYSGNDLTGVNFSPVNPLPPSSPILVNVSGVLDYAGNTFTAASSAFTTGATPDYSNPTVTLDFAGGTTGIATNASFTCHYSEAMDPSSVNAGNTFIYSYVNSANIPVTYTWSTDLTSVTMTPVTPLFADSQYYYACYNAIDLTGNGQNNANSGFYTGSGPISQGPMLLSANPPNGMTNVPVNTNNGPWYGSSLGLLFNEPVASESLGNITLTPNGGSPIPISVYPEYGNTIVWVQLPWALSPNTTYTYNVSGVTDMGGNAITPVTSTFTTGAGFDFTSPTVASTIPANGATTTGIPASVSLTMSEALNPVLITSSQFYLRTHNTQTTIPTTISISPSATPSVGTTVTLTPVTPLAESTIYDIVYWPNNWWPTDIAGNNLSNYGVEATFTTGATGAVNGVCGTANGMTFSAPPTMNLCSAGTVTGLTNAGGALSWSCGSQDGGTAASCSATVTPAQACYAQPGGLVSWWKGDDDATDHMGHNNGTLENGAGFALGAVNDAFSFNGSNQYVLIGQPVPADLQLQNNFAYSAWIYVTSYPANVGSGPYGTIMGSEYGSTDSGIALYLSGSASYTGVPPGAIDLDIGKGSSWYSVLTTTQVPLNQWTLVTATATANQPTQVYFNGVLQPTMTPSGETVWNGTVSYTGSGDGFAIGQTVNENYSFNGLIDEVQVYNTNLTAAQVQSIYNAGDAGVCP
ncbi:MAG: Ig-like domain-containing protein [Terracidiphilus sp.]